MVQEVNITLRFHLAIGKLTLNEIVYRLKQVRDLLMQKVLEEILKSYDDSICDCLIHPYPSTLVWGPLLPTAQCLKNRAPRQEAKSNFEHEVIEAVIETNYRRLIDGRSIDISLGGIHNIIVGQTV